MVFCIVFDALLGIKSLVLFRSHHFYTRYCFMWCVCRCLSLSLYTHTHIFNNHTCLTKSAIRIYLTPSVHKFAKNSRYHLKTEGTRRAPLNKFHTEDPQILLATVQNLVATATWRPGFVHSWITPKCLPETKFESVALYELESNMNVWAKAAASFWCFRLRMCHYSERPD
jgi:hypothetical protein